MNNLLSPIAIFGFVPRQPDAEDPQIAINRLCLGGYIPVIGTVTALARAAFCLKWAITNQITPLTAAGGFFRATLELVPGVGLLVLLPIDIIVTAVREHQHKKHERLQDALQHIRLHPEDLIPNEFRNNTEAQQLRLEKLKERTLRWISPYNSIPPELANDQEILLALRNKTLETLKTANCLIPSALQNDSEIKTAKAQALFNEGLATYQALLANNNDPMTVLSKWEFLYNTSKDYFRQANDLGHKDAAYQLGQLCTSKIKKIIGDHLFTLTIRALGAARKDEARAYLEQAEALHHPAARYLRNALKSRTETGERVTFQKKALQEVFWGHMLAHLKDDKTENVMEETLSEIAKDIFHEEDTGNTVAPQTPAQSDPFGKAFPDMPNNLVKEMEMLREEALDYYKQAVTIGKTLRQACSSSRCTS